MYARKQYVDQKHVNELARKLAKENVKLKRKPNYEVWWHAVCGWFMWVLFRLMGKQFHNYWTTFGNTIYAPAHYHKTELALDEPHIYEIVCQELAHNLDDKRYGWYYKLSYILSWRHRAEVWELRGYGMQMVGEGRVGTIDNGTVESFAKSITGSTYLWAGRYEKVKGTLQTLKAKIEGGEIDMDTFDPEDIHILPKP